MLKITGQRVPDIGRDRRGYYRSPVTLASYRQGKPAANRGRRFPPEVLTPEECYALLHACGRGPAGRRNRAMIVTMWRAGLRCGEMLALESKDVDWQTGRITILHGKGDKRRVTVMDPDAMAILEQWRVMRARVGIPRGGPLFCVISEPTVGRPIHDAYVRSLLKHLAERAGIDKRVHPHGLRHTYAAYLMDRGVGVHKIQAMLGHTSLSVTERYVSHLSPSQVLDELAQLPWPTADGVPPPRADPRA